MNRYVTPVLVAILILTGTGLASQAFAATTITINTDKDVYDHASTITLTGTVNPVDLNEVPVTIQIVSPKGGIAGINQVSVNSDGSFSATFDTSTSLMKDDGIYKFRVNYAGAIETTSIELTNAVETPDANAVETKTAVTGTVVTGTDVTGPSGETFYKLGIGQVDYDATCDASPAFFANADDDSIVIYIDPTNDGILTVTLHEDLIKPLKMEPLQS